MNHSLRSNTMPMNEPEPSAGCSSPRQRPAVPYLVLLVVAIIWHGSLLVSWRTGLWNRFTFDSTATHGRKGWDFYALYQAGHNALQGISIYESDNDKIQVVVPVYTPYRYLPVPAYTLGILFNLATPLAAFWIWAIFLELLLLYCCWRSWRLARTGNEAVILAAFWLLYTPYYLEIYLGQFSLVQASFIFMMMYWADLPTPGCRFDFVWLASLLWKQMTVLFVPLWIIWHRWRGLAVAFLGLALFSIPYYLAFPSALTMFLRNLISVPGSQLGNLGARQLLYSVTIALAPSLHLDAIMLIQGIWIIVILLSSLGACLSAGRQNRWLQIALWTVVFLLVYHDVWEHHYVLLLPVFVLLYHQGPTIWVLAIYGLIAMWTPYRLVDPLGLAAYQMSLRWLLLQPTWMNVAYHACKALPTVALWGYLFVLLLHSHHPGLYVSGPEILKSNS
ncbi:MAG: glycosyltransferase family 87 protein [Anaerolineae bacterium]